MLTRSLLLARPEQVYAVALYVQPDVAVRELSVRCALLVEDISTVACLRRGGDLVAYSARATQLRVNALACYQQLPVHRSGRGGLFADGDEGAYTDALLDGVFFKTLHVVMVRKARVPRGLGAGRSLRGAPARRRDAPCLRRIFGDCEMWLRR